MGQRRKEPKAKAKSNACRMLILLDAGPIRKKALQVLREVQGQLDRQTKAIQRFEQVHLPAFERWKAQHFGATLTELRELVFQLQQKGTLLDEIEWVFFDSGRRNPHAAYVRVTQRRETGEPFPEPKDDIDEDGDDLTEADLKAAFEAFVEDTLDIDPGSLPNDIYNNLFAEFSSAFGTTYDADRPQAEPARAPSASAGKREPKIKNLYRDLARRLHPDTQAEKTFEARKKELWLEVQAAYQDGDLERLEVLAAKADLIEGLIGEHTTVSQIRGITSNLRDSLRAVLQRLGMAERHIAWKFNERRDHSKLQRRQGALLAQEIERLRRDLAYIEKRLQYFMEPPKPKKKRPQAKRKAEARRCLMK